MSAPKIFILFTIAVASLLPQIANAEMPSTEGRADHHESAQGAEQPPGKLPPTPSLPKGMSLEEVLQRAAQPPPEHFPEVIMDDEPRFFLLLEQLEYQIQDGTTDRMNFEGQAWFGFDFDRLWIKTEGQAVFDGKKEGETETDILYSRLITPFWNAQVGLQYANGWESGRYDDRWSAAISLQGLAPGMVEMDSSLYISEEGDVTAAIEAEYNIRFTQRLVFQPRVELGFAAQDISERRLGAGMTDGNFDLRLRYEFWREFAPYVGIRYRLLVGETADRARDAGDDSDDFRFFAGVRLAY